MGKKEKKVKKDKKKGKTQPPTQNASFAGSGIRRGSNSSNYGAVPVQGSGSDSDTSNQNQLVPQGSASKFAYLWKKLAAPLSTLNSDEYEFFSMVSSGDAQGVIKYLTSPDFENENKNINRFNKNGYTALHMAVRRQDEEMINILLKRTNIQLYDTILHAIREDNLEITKFLLRINDKLMKDEGIFSSTTNLSDDEESDKAKITTSQSDISSSVRLPPPIKPKGRNIASAPKSKDPRDDIEFDSEFHHVITPLMLAAQIGSTQLMELFYKRGERLETAEFHHNMNCNCTICAKLDGDGDMTRVHQRYDLYKALCQPEYICLMAQKMKKDPINYAIDKIVKLRYIMKRDPAYDQMYAEFIEGLDKFCTDMLSMCRKTIETRIFLSPKDTEEKERLPHLHPRLWYTVGLDMKNFVAHPNTQNVVYHMWATDNWPDWETYGYLYCLFNLAIRVVTFPIIAMILFAADGTKLGKILGSPISRFLNYVASYFVFLGLVVFQVVYKYQRCNDEEPYFTKDDDTCMKRGPPNMGTEWVLVIYILSFCVSTLKRHQISWYWNMKWNWYDVVFISSFLCVFACWMMAWIWVEDPENAAKVSAKKRLFWDQYSPEVLGECFLAIATMLAFGRLLRFLQVFEKIGPLQVCLGKQIAALISTAFMFLIVLVSAAAALVRIYAPYKDFTGFDDHHKLKTQDDDFCTMGGAVYHLFGHLGDPGSAGELLTWKSPQNATDGSEGIHHYQTQVVGKLILVSYHFIGVLMMYNMLTGYFGQTLSDILKDSDRVWKFTRTELYLTHIKDTVLPPPFNLIPTLRTMARSLKYFTLVGKKDPEPRAACSFRQCCYIIGSQKRDAWESLKGGYRVLILEIVFRYKRFRKETQEQEHCTRDDVLEIGEEITEIREKMRIDGKVGQPDNNEEDSEDDDFNNFPRPQKKASTTNPGGGSSSQGGGRRGSTASKPVTSQPHGSPQAGPSGVTTINMSPVSKPPPPVPINQIAGLYNTSSPNMQKNQYIQMGSYQNPPKVNQRSHSSSLMNVLERDINRNESDSLYGSTTVANAAINPIHPFFNDCVQIQQQYNFNDRDLFPWEKSSPQMYPDHPSFKTVPFQGRGISSDTWEQPAFKQFPLPVVRENVRDDFDRLSPANAGMEPNPRHTWDDSQSNNYPPPYFRGRPKQY